MRGEAAGGGRAWKVSSLMPIRILISQMAPLLADIIAPIVAAQPDMRIVGRAEGDANLVKAAERCRADVIILGQGPSTERRYDELLYSCSHLKIIELVDEGRSGLLFELRPQRVLLGEMSPPGLLDAIRASTSRHAAPI